MKYTFEPELVGIGIEAADQRGAIEAVGSLLVESGFVGEAYPELAYERELSYPTGLATKRLAVALPHADYAEGIMGSHVAVGVLKDPVPFRNMEDPDEFVDVRVVFMLAISEAHGHIDMLSSLMRMLADDELLVHVAAASTSEEVCELLNGFAAAMPAV